WPGRSPPRRGCARTASRRAARRSPPRRADRLCATPGGPRNWGRGSSSAYQVRPGPSHKFIGSDECRRLHPSSVHMEPMTAGPTESTVQERELLETARQGSEEAYRRLVEPHRSELHAHCYRMLGSVQDAEDALQEALVRAWRGLARFEGRSSLRSWLYTISTNTCLNTIERRPKRVLPTDYGPATDPH